MIFDPLFLEQLQALWGWVAAVVTGITGLLGWAWKRKHDRENTYDYMMRNLQELQVKVVELGSREITNSAEIARKNEILNEIKAKCPICYDKVIKMLNNEQA